MLTYSRKHMKTMCKTIPGWIIGSNRTYPSTRHTISRK